MFTPNTWVNATGKETFLLTELFYIFESITYNVKHVNWIKFKKEPPLLRKYRINTE